MKHSISSLFAGVFISTILLLGSAANASSVQPGLHKVPNSSQHNAGTRRIIRKNVQSPKKNRAKKFSATMFFEGTSKGKSFLMTPKGEKCYITLHMNKIIIQLKKVGRGLRLSPIGKTYLTNNESGHVLSYTTLGCLPYGHSTQGPIKVSKQSLAGNVVTYTFKTPGYTIQIKGTVRFSKKSKPTFKGTYQMRQGGYQGKGGIANHSGTWSAKFLRLSVP